MQVWGRANSVNVKKVLWCCQELELEYQRIDAGLEHGRIHDAEYLRLNPNGRVPTLVDGGYVVWESNSILRYLALEYGGGRTLYPEAPRARCDVDRWLDWTLSTLVPSARLLSPASLRAALTPPDPQAGIDAMVPTLTILDNRLGSAEYVGGDYFTIADIALGVYVQRWFGVTNAQKPAVPRLDRWWAQLGERPGFTRWVSRG